MDTGYNNNVFINCPFDADYVPMKQAMMFAVRYCGFKPLLVSMDKNSGEPRIEKIKRLIGESRYGIHDISRCKSTKKNEWYRMNMPFEMGLDFGCGCFSDEHNDKKYLVMTAVPYGHQPSLSDISGNDPQCHDGKVDNLISVIRDFFYGMVTPNLRKKYPQKHVIITSYHEFTSRLHSDYLYDNNTIMKMQDVEYCELVNEYLGKD